MKSENLEPQRTRRNAKEDQHIVPVVSKELPDAAWQRTRCRDPSTLPHAVRRSVPLRMTGVMRDLVIGRVNCQKCQNCQTSRKLKMAEPLQNHRSGGKSRVNHLICPATKSSL